MGKRSRLKKHYRIQRSAWEKEEKREALRAMAIILVSSAILIWSFRLFNKTFMPVSTGIFSAMLVSIPVFILLYYTWRHKHGVCVLIFYAILCGSAISNIMLQGINFYFKSDKETRTTVAIISTDNRKGRYGRCATPYATVELNGVEKELAFPCEYEKTITGYKKVNLVLKKGALGYDVIVTTYPAAGY